MIYSYFILERSRSDHVNTSIAELLRLLGIKNPTKKVAELKKGKLYSQLLQVLNWFIENDYVKCAKPISNHKFDELIRFQIDVINFELSVNTAGKVNEPAIFVTDEGFLKIMSLNYRPIKKMRIYYIYLLIKSFMYCMIDGQKIFCTNISHALLADMTGILQNHISVYINALVDEGLLASKRLKKVTNNHIEGGYFNTSTIYIDTAGVDYESELERGYDLINDKNYKRAIEIRKGGDG